MNVSYRPHTYLVENHFALGQTSLRNQIYSRYSKFVQKLASSPSKEIRFLYRLMINDGRSVIKKNIWFLNQLTKIDVCISANWKVKQVMPTSDIPNEELWRIPLLTKLLDIRRNQTYLTLGSNKTQIQEMIDSLCST